MKVKYKCKQNDIELIFFIDNNEIEEVWVRIIGESCWTVIGYSDLKNGIQKALSKIQGGNK
jgi:hypothetical protein